VKQWWLPGLRVIYQHLQMSVTAECGGRAYLSFSSSLYCRTHEGRFQPGGEGFRREFVIAGLNTTEFFFHTMAGPRRLSYCRENGEDSYIQCQLVKVLENYGVLRRNHSQLIKAILSVCIRRRHGQPFIERRKIDTFSLNNGVRTQLPSRCTDPVAAFYQACCRWA